jgi:hypothetical protein
MRTLSRRLSHPHLASPATKRERDRQGAGLPLKGGDTSAQRRIRSRKYRNYICLPGSRRKAIAAATSAGIRTQWKKSPVGPRGNPLETLLYCAARAPSQFVATEHQMYFRKGGRFRSSREPVQGFAPCCRTHRLTCSLPPARTTPPRARRTFCTGRLASA